MKRIFCLLLVLCLLAGNLAPAAAAQELQPDTTVESGTATVEGTGGLGTFLSAQITQVQEKTSAISETGFTVTDLVIEGSTATVTCDAPEDANLIVALYSEDGMQLLTSANTTVTAGQTQAQVTFAGEMPEYFLASAYLVDTYDFSPLCESYETPLYTQELKQLRESTVEDYDPELVVNLDEDTTTNFLVYDASVHRIESAEGVNIVVTADDENKLYVIENADEQFTSLVQGDVVSYFYGDSQLLLVKVDTIQVEGTTVTITGADMELTDVFTHVKIENEGDTSEITVDESSAGEGVTYGGLVEEEEDTDTAPVLYAGNDGEESKTYAHKFLISNRFATEDGALEVDVGGSIAVSMKVCFTFYVTLSQRYFSYRTEMTCAFRLGVSGKIAGEIPLMKLQYQPIPGVVGIGFSPVFKLEFSASLELEAKSGVTVGYVYSNTLGHQNLNSAPRLEPSVKAEGSFFLGIDLKPGISVGSGTIAELNLTAPVGFLMEQAMFESDAVKEAAGYHHVCGACISGTVSFQAKLGGEIKFLNCDKFHWDITFGEYKLNLLDYYYSYDTDDFGLGSCPNLWYLISFQVTDYDGNILPYATLTMAGNTHQTNEYGVVELYCTEGRHKISGNCGTYLGGVTFWVTQPEKVQVRLYNMDLGGSGEEEEQDTGDDWKDIVGSVVDAGEYTDYGLLTSSGDCGDNVTWELYSSGMLRIQGTGPMTDYSNGKAPWYASRGSITSVEICEGVTSVGNGAFYYCTKLMTATIADTVTNIGSFAFYKCSKLASVNIPDSVITMGDWVFRECTKLGFIRIPDSVTSIDSQTFYGCTGLTAIVLGEGLTEIPDYFCYGCTGLGSVELGETITTIGNYAFEDCTSLTSVILPDSITSLGYDAFSGCTSVTEVKLPSGLTYLHSGTFGGCTSLEEIEFPYGYTSSVGFSGCTSLRSVILPDTIKTIDGFGSCKSLETLEIPDSVTWVGVWAFNNCTGLKEIVLPDSVKTIGAKAFYDCTALESVTLPSGITELPDYLFYNCTSLNNITIPDSVTTIGAYAFYGCNALEEITIPESVTTMESYCVAACEGLSTVVVEGQITILPEYAFTECSNLTDVTLPDTLEKMQEGAFSKCTSLKELTIPEGVITIYAIFDGCTALERIILPDSVDYFAGCTDCPSLREIHFGKDYYGTLHCSLDTCTSLVTLTVSEENERYTVVDNMIYSKDLSTVAFCPASREGSFTVPEGTTTIGKGAFSRTILTEILLPEGLTKIDSDAFANCALTEIHLPDGLLTIVGSAFEYAESLRSVYIPASVTFIGAYAFRYSGLETVTLPEGITEIASHCFTGCKNLISVVIPENVETVGDSAFHNCESLTSIVIPASVTALGGSAFYNCESLTSVTFQGDAPTFGNSIVFKHVKTTVYYPADNETWTSSVRKAYGGTLTWVPYTLDENGDMVTDAAAALVMETLDVQEEPAAQTEETSGGDAPTLDAVYGGEYSTEVSDTYTLKKASFFALEPGGEYLLLAMGSLDVDDPLDPENLLYIGQSAAAADGSLSFTYVQRVSTDLSYVVACGPSTRSLWDASVTFPDMVADGALQAVTPTVEYGGNVLKEGRDYELTGTVTFTEAGTYVCYIRGIHNYTGLLECTYTVREQDCSAGHAYESKVTLPTCTEQGYTTYTCTRCGDSYDAEFEDALGHDWDEGTVTKEPTEEAAGERTYTCTVCGETKTEAIPELGHEHSYEAAVTAPTCTEKGYTTHTCRCGASFVDTYVDALGHKFENGVCTECGEADPDYVEPKPTISGITRIFGDNRYLTSFGIANQLKETLGVEKFQTIIVAYGQNFPDALTGSYLAAVKDAPILLTEDKKQADVFAYIAENLADGGTVYILGGTNAVPASFESALSAKGITAKRLAGDDRYQTNLKILEEAGVTAEQEILICTGSGFADSLSASAAGLPILLVGKELKAEQKEFLANSSGKFVIIGGTSAVSAKLESELKSIGTVERLGGATRYETSVLVAQRFVQNPGAAILAYAKNFPDGLCGGPLAYALGAPLILTDTDHTDAARDYIEGITSGIVVGGPGLISDAAVRTIFGLSANTPITVK